MPTLDEAVRRALERTGPNRSPIDPLVVDAGNLRPPEDLLDPIGPIDTPLPPGLGGLDFQFNQFSEPGVPPEPQARSEKNVKRKIIEALQVGLAAAGSRDPGGSLLKIIQQRLGQDFQEQENARTREERRQTREFAASEQRSAEQRAEAREGRAFRRESTLALSRDEMNFVRTLARDELTADRTLKDKESLARLDTDLRREIETAAQLNRVELAGINVAAQERLEGIRQGRLDKRQVQSSVQRMTAQLLFATGNLEQSQAASQAAHGLRRTTPELESFTKKAAASFNNKNKLSSKTVEDKLNSVAIDLFKRNKFEKDAFGSSNTTVEEALGKTRNQLQAIKQLVGLDAGQAEFPLSSLAEAGLGNDDKAKVSSVSRKELNSRIEQQLQLLKSPAAQALLSAETKSGQPVLQALMTSATPEILDKFTQETLPQLGLPESEKKAVLNFLAVAAGLRDGKIELTDE